MKSKLTSALKQYPRKAVIPSILVIIGIVVMLLLNEMLGAIITTASVTIGTVLLIIEEVYNHFKSGEFASDDTKP